MFKVNNKNTRATSLEIFKNTFFTEHLRWLLLDLQDLWKQLDWSSV